MLVRIHVLDNVFSIFVFEESNIKGDCVLGKVCVIYCFRIQLQGFKARKEGFIVNASLFVAA